jgi:RNA polymerase sigma-70 factor (ECF subfamily)
MAPEEKNPPSRSAPSLAEIAFAQYRPALHRFLMRRLSCAESAKDLAQEAYLRLMRVEDAELIDEPQAYLFRIASNLIYEHRQRIRKDVVTFDSRLVEHASERVPDPLSTLEASEKLGMERQLDSILKQLPPLYAAILVMKKRDGLSLQEIADELDISVHTVKKYLFRAIARCRAARWNR